MYILLDLAASVIQNWLLLSISVCSIGGWLQQLGSKCRLYEQSMLMASENVLYFTY